uniref:Serine protease HTRA2, mitochondrial-like n=1 Tax=Callorhinchus milii TaxID=7868 RepID=A0A4W3GDW2_CALMI
RWVNVCHQVVGGGTAGGDGEVIGVNTMKVTAGISFAIPSDRLREFLTLSQQRKSKSECRVRRDRVRFPHTHLRLRDSRFPDVTHGVLIHKVIRGSPAHLAGLKPGDVLLEINGRTVRTAENVYNAVRSERSLAVMVRRSTEELMMNIEPENSE